MSKRKHNKHPVLRVISDEDHEPIKCDDLAINWEMSKHRGETITHDAVKDTLVEIMTDASSDFYMRALRLSNHVDWVLGEDTLGNTVLVPLKK